MSEAQVAAMTRQVPAEAQTVMLPGSMSPAMLIMLNEPLFRRVTAIAKMMARTSGVIPKHLYDKEGACFAIVTRSMTWKLDPWAVAPCTYETPNGGVGFEGKLCHAALENSGELVGGLSYEHYHGVWVKFPNGLEERFRSNDPALMIALGSPDQEFPDPSIPMLKVKGRGGQVVRQNSWDALIGKYKIQISTRGKPYPVADWPKEAEIGLGVTIRAQLKGEVKPREHHLDLVQAYPRNSTLWPTDPRTQICYLGARRFANLCVPHLFMGLSFDREDLETVAIGPMGAREINPEDRAARPTRGQSQQLEDVEDAEEVRLAIVFNDGEEREFESLDDYEREFGMAMETCAKVGDRAAFTAFWETNSGAFAVLRGLGKAGVEVADGLTKMHVELEAALAQREAEQRQAKQQQTAQDFSATANTETPPQSAKSAPKKPTAPAAPAQSGGSAPANSPLPYQFWPLDGDAVACNADGFAANMERAIAAAHPNRVNELMSRNIKGLERLYAADPEVAHPRIVKAAKDKGWIG